MPAVGPCHPRLGRLAIPLCLVALAIGIRIFNLLALDPFGDEVTWLRWALDHFDPLQPSTYWTPLEDEGRPPLFFWLLTLTTSIDPNAFVGGRLAAALTSGATAGLLYAIGTRLFSRGVGLAAGLLWAILPFGVLFGRLASSDDALLTLTLALVIWASMLVAQRPSLRSGALCGGALALALLAKTLGLLALVIPVAAVLTISPRPWRGKLIQAAFGLILALFLGVSPLLPWAPSMLEKASHHADLEVEQRTGEGPKRDTAYRLTQNTEDAAAYYLAYLGVPLLVLATGVLAVGLARRERAVWFLALTLGSGVIPVLTFTTILYSRYLLGFSLPLYLLGALGIWRIWRFVEIALAQARLTVGWRFAATGIAGSLAVALFGPQLILTRALITEPSEAQLPADDRWRYFDHRWTLLGLDQHIAYLEEAARHGPIMVVQPRDAPEFRFELPYDALRFYLRGNPNIAFDDIPPIRGDASDRAYQTITRSHRPTYLILNDMDPDAEQARETGTDTYEKVLRSIPTAVIAHKSAPRHDGYALTLYRADPEARAAADAPDAGRISVGS